MRDCSGTEDTPQDLADLAASALVHWGKQASAIRLVKVRENAVVRVVDVNPVVGAALFGLDTLGASEAAKAALKAATQRT